MNDPLLNFEGKVALITGGSRGLGYQMAKALAARGADIIIASRKVDACEAVAEEVRAMGQRALAVGAHCGKWDEIDKLIEAAYDLYASRRKVLQKVIIPLVKPGIVAGSILVFIPSIGAYVTPKILGGGKSLMLGNLISNQFGTSRDWPLGSALALFLMALVMVALIIYVRNESRNNPHG